MLARAQNTECASWAVSANGTSVIPRISQNGQNCNTKGRNEVWRIFPILHVFCRQKHLRESDLNIYLIPSVQGTHSSNQHQSKKRSTEVTPAIFPGQAAPLVSSFQHLPTSFQELYWEHQTALCKNWTPVSVQAWFCLNQPAKSHFLGTVAPNYTDNKFQTPLRMPFYWLLLTQPSLLLLTPTCIYSPITAGLTR